MNPWLIYWAPQFHLPLGGDVAQRFDLFDMIAPKAGDAVMERKAFDVASYGRQLGLITEVLMDIAATTPPKSAQAKTSLRRLKKIQADIETLKQRDALDVVADIEALVEKLKQNHADQLPSLRHSIAQLLVGPGPKSLGAADEKGAR